MVCHAPMSLLFHPPVSPHLNTGPLLTLFHLASQLYPGLDIFGISLVIDWYVSGSKRQSLLFLRPEQFIGMNQAPFAGQRFTLSPGVRHGNCHSPS